MKIRFLFVVLVLCLSSPVSAQEVAAPKVEVHIVSLEDIQEVLELPARVFAGESIKIVPRVEGNLLERPVKSGNKVDAGELLYVIDDRQYQNARAAAQAGLAEAKAELLLAKKTLNRAEGLTDKQVISQQKMDEYQSDYDVAITELEAAEKQLEQAEIELSFTQVRARFGGILTNEDVSLNDLVGPTRGAIGRLDVVEFMKVVVHLDEKLDTQLYLREAAGEQLNLDIRFMLPTGDLYTESGEVEEWNNEIDTKTGTRTVKLRFSNPKGILAPGMSGTVLVSEITDQGLLAVPINTVQQDQLGRYVMVVGDDDVLKQQHLELGTQIGEWWVVLSGLQAGQSIVAGSLQRVKPGMAITTVAKQD